MKPEYPVRYIQRKKYYRVPQTASLQTSDEVYMGSACDGCALDTGRTDLGECPEHRDKRVFDRPLLCQDYEIDEDSFEEYVEGRRYDVKILKDYIFIPATKQGIADYVAHLLEKS